MKRSALSWPKPFLRARLNVNRNRVEGIETTKAGVKVKASGKDGEIELEAEQVLLAISFKPNTMGLGLKILALADRARRD